MTKEEIIEGNKTIAKFMRFSFDGEYYKTGHRSEGATIHPDLYSADDLNYHSSWDWLMPVVEKISEIWRQGPSIKYIGQELHKVLSMEIYTEIEYVYLGVFNFIKWYNKHS